MQLLRTRLLRGRNANDHIYRSRTWFLRWILVLLPKPQIPRSNVVLVVRKSFDSGILRWNSSARRNILVGIGRAFHREQRNGRWSEKWFVPYERDQKFYRVTLLDRRGACRASRKISRGFQRFPSRDFRTIVRVRSWRACRRVCIILNERRDK